MVWYTENLVLLVLAAFIFVYATQIGVSADNWLIFGPALFVDIPFKILQAIAGSAPLLVPVAIIGLLVYFNALLKILGEPLVLFAIVLFLGMYLLF